MAAVVVHTSFFKSLLATTKFQFPLLQFCFLSPAFRKICRPMVVRLCACVCVRVQSVRQSCLAASKPRLAYPSSLSVCCSDLGKGDFLFFVPLFCVLHSFSLSHSIHPFTLLIMYYFCSLLFFCLPFFLLHLHVNSVGTGTVLSSRSYWWTRLAFA